MLRKWPFSRDEEVARKTFEDVIRGFDSDRRRVMLVALVLMEPTLVMAGGSLPTSLLLTFSEV